MVTVEDESWDIIVFLQIWHCGSWLFPERTTHISHFEIPVMWFALAWHFRFFCPFSSPHLTLHFDHGDHDGDHDGDGRVLMMVMTWLGLQMPK